MNGLKVSLVKSSRPRYEKCDECGYRVPQILDKVVRGKRVALCFKCARKAGWFDEEGEKDEQGRLF